jgi:hypothetical protein
MVPDLANITLYHTPRFIIRLTNAIMPLQRFILLIPFLQQFAGVRFIDDGAFFLVPLDLLLGEYLVDFIQV